MVQRANVTWEEKSARTLCIKQVVVMAMSGPFNICSLRSVLRNAYPFILSSSLMIMSHFTSSVYQIHKFSHRNPGQLIFQPFLRFSLRASTEFDANFLTRKLWYREACIFFSVLFAKSEDPEAGILFVADRHHKEHSPFCS